MSTREPAVGITAKPGRAEPSTAPATAEIDAPSALNHARRDRRFTDTPTLGIATLLEIFDGDPASVSDLFDAALTSIEADLARIGESVAARDMEIVGAAAHRMKGTSGSIRSQRILELSATLQTAAKQDPWKVDAALLLDLRRAVTELRGDVEAFRRRVAQASAA